MKTLTIGDGIQYRGKDGRFVCYTDDQSAMVVFWSALGVHLPYPELIPPHEAKDLVLYRNNCPALPMWAYSRHRLHEITDKYGKTEGE